MLMAGGRIGVVRAVREYYYYYALLLLLPTAKKENIISRKLDILAANLTQQNLTTTTVNYFMK
jgi:hypothetical protein